MSIDEKVKALTNEELSREADCILNRHGDGSIFRDRHWGYVVAEFNLRKNGPTPPWDTSLPPSGAAQVGASA